MLESIVYSSIADRCESILIYPLTSLAVTLLIRLQVQTQ